MKKIIKVLFFPYGPENPYQPNLAAALQKRGVTVTGIADSTFETLERAAASQDVLHLHWTYPYLIGRNFFHSLEMAFQFFRILIQQKMKGRKLIWTVHNLAEHEKQHPGFELLCHRLLARLADGIIVHSRYAREKTAETYGIRRHSKKIRVIPHGHYIDNYPNDLSREHARARLGIGQDKTVFLFLGQIRPYKGLPELISAFTGIATGKEVLVLAGKPLNEQVESETKDLAGGREDILFFPKFIADGDLQVYLNAADAVVFPFRDIFTSGSVLLAMSFEKALIIPKLESQQTVINVGGAVTYDPHDNQGLAQALRAALTADLPQLGRRNMAEARKLSWDFIASETADFYNWILNG